MPRVKSVKCPPDLAALIGKDRFPVRDDRLEALRSFAKDWPFGRKEKQ